MRVTEFAETKEELLFAVVPFVKYKKGYEFKSEPKKGYALYAK